MSRSTNWHTATRFALQSKTGNVNKIVHISATTHKLVTRLNGTTEQTELTLRLNRRCLFSLDCERILQTKENFGNVFQSFLHCSNIFVPEWSSCVNDFTYKSNFDGISTLFQVIPLSSHTFAQRHWLLLWNQARECAAKSDIDYFSVAV